MSAVTVSVTMSAPPCALTGYRFSGSRWELPGWDLRLHVMTLTKLFSLSEFLFLSLRMGLWMLSIQSGNPVSLEWLPYSIGFCGCHLTPVFTEFMEGFGLFPFHRGRS